MRKKLKCSNDACKRDFSTHSSNRTVCHTCKPKALSGRVREVAHAAAGSAYGVMAIKAICLLRGLQGSNALAS